MQKKRRFFNWLVILMCAILAALSFWSVRILITNINHDSSSSAESEYTFVNQDDSLSYNEHQTLVVGGDDSNPPYSYLEEGEAMGLDNDLMREVAKNLGMKVVFNLSPLAEARQELIKGNLDVIGGMAFSLLQDDGLLYGTPHAVQYYDLFVRKDSGISSITSMKEK
ncbi:MAG: hypothetical protein CVU45_06730, partial [Chloroflexi bacterium HGW-Chloroflexi-7]